MMSEIKNQSAEMPEAPKEFTDEDLAKVSGGFAMDEAEKSLGRHGQELDEKMNALVSKGNVSQEEMKDIQFEAGQYNAKRKSIESIQKSLGGIDHGLGKGR